MSILPPAPDTTPEARRNRTARVLREAANHIRVHGWTQGHFSRKGACCAIGAINASQGMRPSRPLCGDRLDAERALRKYLQISYKRLFLSVSEWNDDEDRTSKDVISTLEAAAGHLLEGKK